MFQYNVQQHEMVFIFNFSKFLSESRHFFQKMKAMKQNNGHKGLNVGRRAARSATNPPTPCGSWRVDPLTSSLYLLTLPLPYPSPAAWPDQLEIPQKGAFSKPVPFWHAWGLHGACMGPAWGLSGAYSRRPAFQSSIKSVKVSETGHSFELWEF